ncbi:leucyl aminopeptidase [Candidatus Uhrbacteria bacterium]|nr:leucyl aminopeptidase [Candidatus Uhrbacteria bacterium]
MEMRVYKGDLTQEKADLLVVGHFSDAKVLSGALSILDKAMAGRLAKLMNEDGFKAKLATTFFTHVNGEIAAKRVLVVGLGKKEEVDLEAVRQAAAVAVNVAKECGAKTVVSELHLHGGLKASDCAQAMVEGARLADYSFNKYKKPSHKSPKLFAIVANDGRDVRSAEKGLALGELAAQGTIFARDLVNTPAHDVHPETLVDVAKAIAKGKSSIRVRVFDREALKRMGAGGILGVAQGSDHPPYLVHMTYKPAKPSKKSIALVGKAVTFDSGGLSLKPADFMMTMKCDMAGAAAVLGAFSVIARLAPAVEVHGIFGAVENMPSGGAIRPGDVLTAMNKKTMEVLNTDAEGRLTLADTLSYAVKLKPSFIVDLATLTGACVVALGEEITGLMSNDDKVAAHVLSAAALAGEKMWRLPLEKNYKKVIKSQVADLQNIGNKWGGALTAGLFLEEFVDKTPWVHLDIAGPAFAERDIDAYTHKGATGHGVRTLSALLRSL